MDSDFAINTHIYVLDITKYVKYTYKHIHVYVPFYLFIFNLV